MSAGLVARRLTTTGASLGVEVNGYSFLPAGLAAAVLPKLACRTLAFLPHLECPAVPRALDVERDLHVRPQPIPEVAELVVHHRLQGHQEVVAVIEMVAQGRRGQPDTVPVPDTLRDPMPFRALDRVRLACHRPATGEASEESSVELEAVSAVADPDLRKRRCCAPYNSCGR